MSEFDADDATVVPVPVRRAVQDLLCQLDAAVVAIADDPDLDLALWLSIEYREPVMRVVLTQRRPGERDTAVGFVARLEARGAGFVDLAAAVDRQEVKPFLYGRGVRSTITKGSDRTATFGRAAWRATR